ncbi:related to translation initiation factor eIF-4B [Cephalotrichum gorgonifer]|uniref:Related to translation initiation factor eIF-4B n=1 Tax=Cephalotrichum gorgonifer TaxID=2041049 RepID=A0AAE8SVY1_9PEZI|nr:related to translation initiation factor eIF-4B [Cephalotrichum gorgonifer]
MSLGDFMNEPAFGGGSWADEVEDTIGTQPLPAPDNHRGGGMGSSSFGGDRGYARSSAPLPLPTRPPFTAHIGNLPYDVTMEALTEIFESCGVANVRIIEDRELQRPKGFAYIEFNDLDGLKKGLDLDGETFSGRYMKVKVADTQRSSGGESNRDLSDWSRKGPLADLPGRGGDRQGSGSFGDRGDRGGFGDRRAPREPMADDGKVRDFGNWERRGPLSPRVAEAPMMSREGSRARSNIPADRHQGASWGEGREEGSRPPRKEFEEKPPTAAERDTAWRNSMRPDARNTPASQSGEGSEAPSSPAPAAAVPATRPKLNLAKRTVSVAETADAPAAATPTDGAKSNPFGAARPIDTLARERAIEERRLKEKLEAEEKQKEERRLAKEAAAKEEAEKAEAAKADAESQTAKDAAAKDGADKAAAGGETKAAAEGEKSAEAGNSKEQRLPARTREPREQRPKIADGGNWRSASGDQRTRGAPTGPRRGGGAPRGGRNEGPRPPRTNGSQQQAPAAAAEEPASPATDADGWTTVPKGSRRPGGRPLAS